MNIEALIIQYRIALLHADEHITQAATETERAYYQGARYQIESILIHLSKLLEG